MKDVPFKTPPPNRVGRVLVVAASVKKLLLVQTSNRPNVWELPGGKMKWFEAPHEAALRELTEETGLAPGALVPKHCYVRQLNEEGAKRYEHFIFACTYQETPSVTIDHHEIMAYKWVTLDEALEALHQLEWLSRYYLSRIRSPAATTKHE